MLLCFYFFLSSPRLFLTLPLLPFLFFNVQSWWVEYGVCPQGKQSQTGDCRVLFCGLGTCMNVWESKYSSTERGRKRLGWDMPGTQGSSKEGTFRREKLLPQHLFSGEANSLGCQEFYSSSSRLLEWERSTCPGAQGPSFQCLQKGVWLTPQIQRAQILIDIPSLGQSPRAGAVRPRGLASCWELASGPVAVKGLDHQRSIPGNEQHMIRLQALSTSQSPMLRLQALSTSQSPKTGRELGLLVQAPEIPVQVNQGPLLQQPEGTIPLHNLGACYSSGQKQEGT